MVVQKNGNVRSCTNNDRNDHVRIMIVDNDLTKIITKNDLYRKTNALLLKTIMIDNIRKTIRKAHYIYV
jgi:hypothetical protein